MCDIQRPRDELEFYRLMIPDYMTWMIQMLRDIPADKWHWSFNELTPTPRDIAEHTFAWLWCDRNQLRGQDAPSPPPPAEQSSMCDMLEEERQRWDALLLDLEAGLLETDVDAFGVRRNARGQLYHIGQDVIYKTGQVSMLYFALGLDGDSPYSAPYPNHLSGLDDRWPAPRS